jgi:hypothetical protein
MDGDMKEMRIAAVILLLRLPAVNPSQRSRKLTNYCERRKEKKEKNKESVGAKLVRTYTGRSLTQT